MSELRNRRGNTREISGLSDQVDSSVDKGSHSYAPPLNQLARLELANHRTVRGDGQVSWSTAKWVILRATGGIYFIAFLGAIYQNPGLMGSQGLQPASDFFSDRLQAQYSDPWEGFLHHPTIFWYVELNDNNLMLLYQSGLALSTLVIMGMDSMIAMAILWLLYFSIVTIAGGTSFYNYGWESQLLETGFLCVFLCDVFPSLRLRPNDKSPPSPFIMWLFRWLCFRISIGAGLIKIRGDTCWTQKTCLRYHFETQPIPSPLSFVFHFLPKWVLTHAVDLDLFVQVYTSWMVLLPTHVPGSQRLSDLFLWVVRLGGFIQAGFMVNILLSGNFAFLNHLTIIPAMACLDDACWPGWLSQWTTAEMKGLTFKWKNPRLLLDIYLCWLIGNLSLPVVENLLQIGGRRQQMNASFGSFRLVNTYGAFGSVGQSRYEPIISITYNGQDWIELDLPCKPGNVTRMPCFVAPYHLRADWNIWFIGFKPHMQMLRGRESWLFALVSKILEKKSRGGRPWLHLLDPSSANLLEENYERKFMTPLYVKVDMYHYQMAAPLWELLPDYLEGNGVVWWKRSFEETLIPPVRRDEERGRLVAAAL